MIELFDITGKAEREAPEQIAATGVKVGIIAAFTVRTPLTYAVPSQAPPPVAEIPPY